MLAARLGPLGGIRVNAVVSIGPRFDQTIGFAGKSCAQDAEGDKECDSISTLYEDLSDEGERAAKRGLPRPWSLTLEMRFTF